MCLRIQIGETNKFKSIRAHWKFKLLPQSFCRFGFRPEMLSGLWGLKILWKHEQKDWNWRTGGSKNFNIPATSLMGEVFLCNFDGWEKTFILLLVFAAIYKEEANKSNEKCREEDHTHRQLRSFIIINKVYFSWDIKNMLLNLL